MGLKLYNLSIWNAINWTLYKLRCKKKNVTIYYLSLYIISIFINIFTYYHTYIAVSSGWWGNSIVFFFHNLIMYTLYLTLSTAVFIVDIILRSTWKILIYFPQVIIRVDMYIYYMNIKTYTQYCFLLGVIS